MTEIALRITVPIACFRQSRAREYVETYPVPPPSTVYGMLLSLVGETDRYKHCGTQLAIGLLSEPEKSKVIRIFHRYKTKDFHDPRNARPDYQELLTHVDVVAWVAPGSDRATPTLPDRLRQAFENPAAINRFGGLSLGESRDLVDSVSILPETFQFEALRWLVRDSDGELTLPYWVDHVGSRGSRWQRYLLQESCVWQPPELAWTTIAAS